MELAECRFEPVRARGRCGFVLRLPLVPTPQENDEQGADNADTNEGLNDHFSRLRIAKAPILEAVHSGSAQSRTNWSSASVGQASDREPASGLSGDASEQLSPCARTAIGVVKGASASMRRFREAPGQYGGLTTMYCVP